MGECCDGVCSKCMSTKYMVVGLVILLTAVYWPGRIWHVLGVLLILKGLLKMAMPGGCGHCNNVEMKKPKRR